MYTRMHLIVDVLIKIFQNLKLNDMATLMLVCKHWRDVINSSNEIWKRYIPRCKEFKVPNSKTSKLALQKIRSKSFVVGEEMWYPDPWPLLISRTKMIQFCDQWGNGRKKPDRSGFKMYIRLNPVYDFINGHEDEALAPFINRIWEEFNTGQPFTGKDSEEWRYHQDKQFEVKSVDDAIRHSRIVHWDSLFMREVQCFLEPSYIRRGNVSQQLNLERLSLSTHYEETYLLPSKFEVVEDVASANQSDYTRMAEENVRKNYHPPTFGFYQKLVKTMLGPKGDQSARKFFLTDGCFNENFEYSMDITIGKNAVIYVSKFYDL